MFIVYKKPTMKNYIIVKVAKETDKTYIIDQYDDSNFVSIEASIKKEHVVWMTEYYEAATQVRNAITIAHKNRKDMIKLAEDGYNNHITNVMKMVEGK